MSSVTRKSASRPAPIIPVTIDGDRITLIVPSGWLARVDAEELEAFAMRLREVVIARLEPDDSEAA